MHSHSLVVFTTSKTVCKLFPHPSHKREILDSVERGSSECLHMGWSSWLTNWSESYFFSNHFRKHCIMWTFTSPHYLKAKLPTNYSLQAVILLLVELFWFASYTHNIIGSYWYDMKQGTISWRITWFFSRCPWAKPMCMQS